MRSHIFTYPSVSNEASYTTNGDVNNCAGLTSGSAPVHDVSHSDLSNIHSSDNIRSSSNKLLNFTYFNARSVKNKLPDLHHAIYNQDPSLVFCITESWLNDSVTNSMIDPLG